MPHEKKVISARDVFFDKNKVWDKRSFQLTVNEIKKLNKAIEVVKIAPSDKIEGIQLAEDKEIEAPDLMILATWQQAN